MPPIVSLSPSVLMPHPQNPRPRLSEAEVAELRASIQAHGQVQPCVVRAVGENGSKKYEVVVGHRRAFVGKLLDRDVPCLVEDLDDDEALALMLSDNRVRTDPDPFMESKARNSASLVPPAKSRPLAVDIIGPHIGDLKFTCHFFSSVRTSHAWTAPIWSLAASVGVISRPDPR